jgi:hypothetical protein
MYFHFVKIISLLFVNDIHVAINLNDIINHELEVYRYKVFLI